MRSCVVVEGEGGPFEAEARKEDRSEEILFCLLLLYQRSPPIDSRRNQKDMFISDDFNSEAYNLGAKDES